MSEFDGQRDRLPTILVVEDDPAARMALEDIFEALGYRCLAAHDGREALAHFTAHAGQVDLVLSDMKMPGMSGVDLYRQLKELDPNVRLVLTTGYSLEHEAAALRALGILGWIQKPLSIDRLAETLRDVLATPD
jgi:CheY-like chemotaxis protein